MSAAVFEYQALPVFVPFHTSLADDRLIVGGYGSGKSHALCAEAIALGFEHPGAEFLVMRKTVPALKTTTEKIFLSLLPEEFLEKCIIARAGGHLDYLQFPNGTLYYFRGCDDWRKHMSMNLAFIVWDESDEFTDEDFDQLQSRLRQVHPTPAAKKLGAKRVTRRGNILACNPRGHNWIWRYFVEEDGDKHLADSTYFISTSFDNPYLPVSTLKKWLAMPDPWVKRYVLCSFEEFAGSIYPEWNYNDHVIKPFKDSAGRYTYEQNALFRMGFDPGTSDLNAGVWVYYEKARHRFVAVAEYAEGGLSVAKHAEAWRRLEAEHRMRVRNRIADPGAVNNRDRGSNVKLSDLYAKKGYHFALGPQKVDDRVWTLGELIANGRFVVTNECPRLYEQILSYQWEDLTPTQIEKGRVAKPLKKDVDLVDAAQYAVSQYIAPPPVEPKPSDEDPRDKEAREVCATIRKQIKRKRKRRSQHDLGGMRV